ncbi:DUF2784 domain-containing protein [Catenulispora sp. NF23]|uniref:DUF2784 domain-containing protein n=1 Tax=Catenulispora pinistramenti TaxID=2705254 RepID=A0ABS5KYF6_9ACTN|nr:DUF2784 domain-containing protein [Catenulispora pinistramenti]MBS2536534.1 DUF2784 domain-containing protein [Catenulispora pinistramenti]MBS2550980.1 DUF2784 domain-containing protein [Catenulispora pinistramenti]
MGYRFLIDATMTVHYSFVAFVVVGGYLALRWPRVFYVHATAVVWLGVNALGVKCPLTLIENWCRERLGEPGIPQGFIATHITGVLYPSNLEWLFRWLVVLAIAFSWFLLARRHLHRDKGSNAGDISGVSGSLGSKV